MEAVHDERPPFFMEILWNLLDDHFLVVYQIKARREILDEIYSGRIFDLFYELARGVVNRNRKFFLYKDFERSVTAYGDKIGARDFGGDFVYTRCPVLCYGPFTEASVFVDGFYRETLCILTGIDRTRAFCGDVDYRVILENDIANGVIAGFPRKGVAVFLQLFGGGDRFEELAGIPVVRSRNDVVIIHQGRFFGCDG